MSTKNTSLSFHDLRPRPSQSGQPVLEICSDILRSSNGKPKATGKRRSISRSGPGRLLQVNKKCPRILPSLKSSFTSFQQPLKANYRPSQLPPFFLRQPNISKSRTSEFTRGKLLKPNRNNTPGGGGEGSYIVGGRSRTSKQAEVEPPAKEALLPLKDCHLKNVLRSAKHCLAQLRDANNSLSTLVAQDEQLARGIKTESPTEEQVQLSDAALKITHICREAFVPAHRLNQTAIALHSAEDFLRSSSGDAGKPNMEIPKRKVQIPATTFNLGTLMKLCQVINLAVATHQDFKGKGKSGQSLQEIIFCLLTACQYFYSVVRGCQEIFKVLLYSPEEEQAQLKEFFSTLSAVERSDMLVEMQDVRRIIDEIVIFLEKLSWGSFAIYRLAGGKDISSASAPSSSSDEASASRSASSTSATAGPVPKKKLGKKKKKVGVVRRWL